MRLRASLLVVVVAMATSASAATPIRALTARWDTATGAIVAWAQDARSCLYRQPLIGPAVFLDCYDQPGQYTISFGVAGSLDAAYRPQAGDTYVLISGDTIARAPLRGVTFLPVSRS